MKTKGGLGLDNLVNQYDFFDWMSGVFLPRFQDLQSGGNGAFGSGNFLIGAPRLSQTRVATDSCEWKRFSGAHHTPITSLPTSGECFGELTQGDANNQATESFGPWHDPDRYTPTATTTGDMRYIIDLQTDVAWTEQMLQDLRATDWVGSASRTLRLSFLTYNDAYPMLCYVTINVRIRASGSVKTSVSAKSLRPHGYICPNPNAQMVMEAILMVFTAVFCFNELSEIVGGMKSQKSLRGKLICLRKYCASFKNLLDWCMIALTVIAAGFWLQLHMELNHMEFDLYTTKHVDLEKVVFLSHSYRLLSIAALLFHALGLLPYLDMSAKLSLVTRAIGRAMVDLPSFGVVFLAVLSSYAFIGHLLFGPHIKEWRTLLGAYETCWDMMRWSGWRFERLRMNFEAESEDDATPLITAAVFYYSYVGLMQFMCALCRSTVTLTYVPPIIPCMSPYRYANILTAILMGGYQSVRRSMQEGSEDYRFEKDVGPLARTMLRSFVRCAHLARLRLRHPRGIPRSSEATIFWDENRWLSLMQEIFRNHDHSIRGAVKKPVVFRTGTLLSEMKALDSVRGEDVLYQWQGYFRGYFGTNSMGHREVAEKMRRSKEVMRREAVRESKTADEEPTIADKKPNRRDSWGNLVAPAAPTSSSSGEDMAAVLSNAG